MSSPELEVVCPTCGALPGYPCGDHILAHVARRALVTTVGTVVKPKAQRQPVDELHQSLSPVFLQWLARLGHYGASKYEMWNYAKSRLEGDRDPLNHVAKHLGQYQRGEKYDAFDGDRRWHLVAIAFNAGMAFYAHSRWGFQPHGLVCEEKGDFDAKDST